MVFTTGGTGGGAGSAAYNLSLAQFQQRVATAEIECRRCNPGCKGKKFCKKLVCCKYCTCAREQNALGGGDCFSRDCCKLAKRSLSSCTSQRSCRKCCPCSRSRSSSSGCSSHK